MIGLSVKIWYWKAFNLSDIGKPVHWDVCMFASVCGRMNHRDSLSIWAQLFIQRKTNCLYKPMSVPQIPSPPSLSFTHRLSLSLLPPLFLSFGLVLWGVCWLLGLSVLNLSPCLAHHHSILHIYISPTTQMLQQCQLISLPFSFLPGWLRDF